MECWLSDILSRTAGIHQIEIVINCSGMMGWVIHVSRFLVIESVSTSTATQRLKRQNLQSQRTSSVADRFVGVNGWHWACPQLIINNSSKAVRDRLSDAVSMSHAAHPLALVETAVGVRFRSVPVLKAIFPRSFILGAAGSAASDPVASFKAATPFAFIRPASFCFNA